MVGLGEVTVAVTPGGAVSSSATGLPAGFGLLTQVIGTVTSVEVPAARRSEVGVVAITKLLSGGAAGGS